MTPSGIFYWISWIKSSEMKLALFANAFASGVISAVDKPETVDHDGPQGLALNDNDGNSWINCCSFPSASLLAQTWNQDLAYEMGSSAGEENYWIGGSGWYAPASKVMRACDAMMCSGWAGIGGLYSAYDYNLLTSVLRGEWGYHGYVVTDYDQGNCAFFDVAVNRMVRAGTDQHMLDLTLSPGVYTSLDTPTGVMALRTAVKNTLYTVVNSALFNRAVPGAKVHYKMSTWRIGVCVFDGGMVLAFLLGVLALARRSRKEKEHPEMFRMPKQKVNSFCSRQLFPQA